MKTNDYIAAKLSTLLLLLLAYCFCAPQLACAQDENEDYVTVTVKFYKEEGKKEVPQVNTPEMFAFKMREVTITNLRTKAKFKPNEEDGSITIKVKRKDKLRFSAPDFKLRDVTIDKFSDIEVHLISLDTELDEAIVNTGQVVRSGAGITIPKPRGNYLIYNYKLRVHRKHFGRDGRLIAQPVLYNHDKDTMFYLRPKVFERPEYNKSQDRMYGFDVEENDPLGEYITAVTKEDSLKKYYLFDKNKAEYKDLSKFKKSLKRVSNFFKKRLKHRKDDQYYLTWVDSAWVENPRDFVSTTLRYKTEDYMEVKWDSTEMVSVGTSYPLRWLEYDAGIAEINDGRVPKINKESKEESDKADLYFPNGKAYFDPENEHNKQELAKLEERIRTYTSVSYYNLQRITMTCTSSPEGRYADNAKLAYKRSAFAVEEVRKIWGKPDADIRPQYDVAPWTAVAELLRKDSLFEQADAIERIAKSSPNDMDAQGKEIRNLDKVFPDFYELLKQKYLPQLRRMDYSIKYNMDREPTLEETRENYAKHKDSKLPEYAYWQLYRNAENDSISESLCREALAKHPKSSYARLFAHDLQVYLIRQHRPDTTLLLPYIGIGKWDEINVAHAVALLQTGHLQSAVNHMHDIRLTGKTKFLKSICAALTSGNENDPVYDEIASSSQCNHVVVLLHQDKNEEAYDIAQQMPDSLAMKHYLMATCLSRLWRANSSKVEGAKNKAKQHLEKAFELDPELKIVFEKDADVNIVFFEGDEDASSKQLFAKMLPRHKRLEEKESKRPRTQNFLEYEGKPYGSKWKGYHVIDKPE